MTTSKIAVTEGSGKNIASNSISEDAVTKELQRIILNDSAGVELTANVGALTETAPATDTASSGLNGRLQRIAQRITSLIALLPAALGANGGLKIEGITGGVAQPVSMPASAQADGHSATIGITTGAAVITDANGTLQQYLRGIVKTLIAALNVGGAAAHDAAISGNPIRNGARAVSAEMTAVANGDISDEVASLTGKKIVLVGANPENTVYGSPAAITGVTATQIIAAQGAGVKIYATSVIVTNSHATVGTLVTIQDNSATPVVLWQGYCAPAGGGFAISFPTPLPTTANQALMAICGTTGANVYVSAAGYKGI